MSAACWVVTSISLVKICTPDPAPADRGSVQHDCGRTRNDKRVLSADFADSLNELLVGVSVEVLLDTPCGARRDLSVNVSSMTSF